MSELFGDTLNEFILGGIQSEIEEHLFEQWSDNHANEGPEVLEYEFFSFASPEIKEQYNEFYGYEPGDEFYL